MSFPVTATDITDPDPQSIILIERRTLVRECLVASLQRASGYHVLPFACADKYLESADRTKAGLIVLCMREGLSGAEASRQISLLANSSDDVPLVLISDDEDPDQIVKVLDAGARGFIPSNLPLTVTVEAMRLVRAGGTFVPASSLMAVRRSAEGAAVAKPAGNGMFTPRQVDVIEALRQGKANKIIAYELEMRESTVKVHVRNIMRKLKATNRTQVAYIAHEMMAQERALTDEIER
jgi:DNA-binding NarL/FixJ family response regulator